jgi:hypothetical protein
MTLLPKVQFVAGEELKIGQWVAINKEDGKLYRAVAGRDERAFCIPPEAVFKDGIMTIPEYRWPLR